MKLNVSPFFYIKINFTVIGVWTATESWHQNSSLNYGGNDYVLTVSYDFQENNVVQSRTVLKMNGKVIRDTEWIILNSTWAANDNVITLSNGKKFVIANEEFNDLWSNPQIVLHFKKVC